VWLQSALTPNRISVGEKIFKLLHPNLQSEVHELITSANEWKYVNIESGKPYKVYTTKELSTFCS
jgi:hypothetical protein